MDSFILYSQAQYWNSDKPLEGVKIQGNLPGNEPASFPRPNVVEDGLFKLGVGNLPAVHWDLMLSKPGPSNESLVSYQSL